MGLGSFHDSSQRAVRCLAIHLGESSQGGNRTHAYAKTLDQYSVLPCLGRILRTREPRTATHAAGVGKAPPALSKWGSDWNGDPLGLHKDTPSVTIPDAVSPPMKHFVKSAPAAVSVGSGTGFDHFSLREYGRM